MQFNSQNEKIIELEKQIGFRKNIFGQFRNDKNSECKEIMTASYKDIH